MKTNLMPPVPVRFSRGTARRLARASKLFKVGTSQLIRQAVDRQLPEWEKTGVVLIAAEEK